MFLTIHRGSQQIGGSCVELRTNNGERLLLDCGMPLTRPDGTDWPFGTMSRHSQDLLAEGVLPRIEGLYAGRTPEFSALVLSHAHMDHHGLAHHVHSDVPVYGSRGTIEMLNVSRLFVPGATLPAKMVQMPVAVPVAMGPFTVRGIPVDHAAPDALALLVEADGQRVLYSGDLRAHGRRRDLFDSLPASAGHVDVLVLEGTTIGQAQGSHGFANEEEVERCLCSLLTSDPGLVVVIASGQNIDRAVSVYQAALAAGRDLVLDPYQAYVLMTLKGICPDAPQFDSPSVRVKFVRNHVAKLKEAGLWRLACRMSRAGKVTSEQLAANPKEFVCLARSSGATVALLNFLKRTALPTIVWSQWSGYLEKNGPVPLFCAQHGIRPVQIHSGGHAHPDDLARLVSLLDPKVVVPIHTEAGSRYAELMRNVHVMKDGEPTDIASLVPPA